MKKFLSDSEIEKLDAKRKEWLSEHSAGENDVFEDDKGEFIYGDNENGNPTEDGYSVETIQVYLPEEFQNFRQ